MEKLGEIEEGVLDNSEDLSGVGFTRPILDESIQSGFLNRSSLEGSIQSQKLLRSSLEGSVQTGSVHRSLDGSVYSRWQRPSSSSTSLQSGSLEDADQNESIPSGILDKYLQHQSIQSGTLDKSEADHSHSSNHNQSIPHGFFDRFLQNQSLETGSLSGFLTPQSGSQNLTVESRDLNKSLSDNSVQSGYLENSIQSVPLDQSSLSTKNDNLAAVTDFTRSTTHYNVVHRPSAERSSNNSNRSSISVKSSSNLSFHSQYSSEEEMKEMTSRISSPGDLENMMVEVGNLNSSHISPSDFQTAISNRDTVISRLSSNLNQVLQEREEDGMIANKLEEEITVLKDQVRLAFEKASKNKEFKVKFQELKVEYESLQQNISLLNSDLDDKTGKVAELEGILGVKNKEISNFKTSKNILLDKLQSVQDQLDEKTGIDENQYKMKIKELESLHANEINDIKEKHENELQEIVDKHEEEQVVELNLLDMELERLKDEKIDLADQLETAKEEIKVLRTKNECERVNTEQKMNKRGGDEVNEVQLETETLVKKLVDEKVKILEKLSSMEKLYEDEKKIRESVQNNLEQEKCTRESLELDLASLGSVLDETQYQFLPRNVRESLERSVRLSIESGRLSTSRRESLNLIFGTDQSVTNPPNVTQGDFEYHINDSDSTPTHKPVQALADEAEVVTALRAQHEKEMCELRKYFENVCKELEMKYRAEIEENMKRNVPTPGWMGVGLPSGPVSLELGPAQIEFEFESMSPRSGFSSDNQISFNSNYHHSRENSGISVISDAETESDSSNRNALKETDSDKDSQTYKHCESKINDNVSPNIRKQHEDQVIRLQSRIRELENELQNMEFRIKESGKTESEAEKIKEEYENKMKEIETDYRGAIELARENVKKELEAEHLKKFQMVSKQIQSLQKSELDKLRSDLNEEHSSNVRDINDRFKLEIQSLEDALKDIQESHKLEIKELEKKYKNQLNEMMMDKQESLTEITPDIYQSMKDDLKNLELERDHLRSMQTLMKELISDLALHYNLSEKQIKLLSESAVFDSFNTLSGLPNSEQVTPINTPFKYFKQQLRRASSKATDSTSAPGSPQTAGSRQTPSSILALKAAMAVCSPLTAGEMQTPSIIDLENLSDGSFATTSAQSEQILLDLREKVMLANNGLIELGQGGGMLSKLATIMSTPAVENREDDAGGDDQERLRLVVQLEEAHQRIQELELSGRASMSRSDVISGCGEAGGAGMEMGEVRERASKVLSNYREDQDGLGVEELMSILGELLVFSDNISAQAKDRVEDIEQQLEVADKQLKSTRAFLEEQALDRDQEREEWEKRFKELEKFKREHVEKIVCDEDESGDLDSERSQTPQQKVIELENELSSAVDKIYELRDIIRNLEQKLESRMQGEIHQGEVVKELRLALEEAVVGHQLVQQELELLRSSSSDAEFVEHIRGLEEQLGSKTQELKKHRAAANHIQDIRAQLRGLEERVEQSTRELEHSVCDHLGSTSTSSCSSRQSSPVPTREVEGGSYEDVGSSLSGLEVEEVARLEKKLKYLEKAETAAVDKVKKLETDNIQLKKKVEECEDKLKEMNVKYLSLQSELENSKAKNEDYLSKEEKIKHERKQNEMAQERLEELEEERGLLQERLTQQQMQISSLQSSIQTSRHRVGNGSKEETQRLLQEKESLRAELEQVKIGLKMSDAEKIQAIDKVQILKGEVLNLESKLEMIENVNSESSCIKWSKMTKDISELKDVNEKLQAQLSVARAAQLAAQKTEMPILAQKLLDEKNQEIDLLRNQLLASNTSLSLKDVKHSTPNSLTWTSKLEDSRGSVEQLRDASQMRMRLPELSLEIQSRVDNTVKVFPGSNQKLQTIQENEGFTDSFAQISNKIEKHQIAKKLPINNSDLDISTNNHDVSESDSLGLDVEGELKKTISQPEADFTQSCQISGNLSGDEIKTMEHLEEVINAKVSEIEFMTKVLNQKEDLIETLNDNVEELEAKIKDINNLMEEEAQNKEALVEKLNQEVEEKNKLVETSQKEIEMVNNLTIKLNSAEERNQELEKRVLSGGDSSLVQEIRVLREERQDRIEGMENLHQIIASAQNQIESKNKELQTLKEELFKVEANLQIKVSVLNTSEAKIDELQMQLNEKLEQITTLECQVQETKNELSSCQQQKIEVETKLHEHLEKENSQSSIVKVIEEKYVLEKQLEKVTMEMASVQKVVTEMTLSFKNQILLKDQELQKVCDNFQSISSIKSDLEKRCTELDDINQACKEKIDHLERKVLENTHEIRKELDTEKYLEHGSLEDLSNLVQAELDLSSELDNTLLSQVVNGLGLDQTDVSSSSIGISEVQRLLKKIQGDGIKVLSLSERLFLMQHANVSQNINVGEVRTGGRHEDDNGSKERELERRLGVLEFQLEQEKVLSQDLRTALATEKKNGLENLSKIGKERMARSDLETQLEKVEKELELAKSLHTQHQLNLRGNQLHFSSDSENEEFLNTIEAQKMQIISLEESLKVEKDNFSQLQHILEVERGRGKRDGSTGRWDEKVERRLAQLQEDLDQERVMRRNLEDSVMTDDIGRMIIKQLQNDLQYERVKLKELESVLNKERNKYSDLYVEYDHLKKSRPDLSSETPQLRSGQESVEFEKQMRCKNLELERYSSELEMKHDVLEREMRRVRGEVMRLEGELKEERERNLSGLNKDQLVRMKQVNTFLEHNLKENGEMLQSLAKLHEEKQQMKRVNWELQDKLGQCVCLSQIGAGGSNPWVEPDQKTFYGKYLRAESFRKALVWQKRYLLVLLCGELVSDPVLMVVRENKLGRNGRFRAIVHTIISISRMKFLVKRWRSGKRAGAHASSSKTWSESLFTGRSSEAPNTGRSSAGVPSLDLNSPVSGVSLSPSFGVSASARSQSQFTKSQSVPSYNLVSPRKTSPTPSNRLPPTYNRPRNPPTFGRSHSLRSSMPRPTTLGLNVVSTKSGGDDISLSSSNPSSNSSHQIPAVTGFTPPTRDTMARRSRSSAPGASEDTNSQVRRSLGSQFRERNTVLAAVGDNTLQRDLEEYIKRFGSLQENRGKHF